MITPPAAFADCADGLGGPCAPSVGLAGGGTITGQTVAELQGGASSTGYPATYYYEYGPTTAYGSMTTAVSLPPQGGSTLVRQTISGLTPSTTYHIRLVATNQVGTSRTADQTFTTDTPDPNPPSGSAPPKAQADAATALGPDNSSGAAPGDMTATLNGTINPHNFATSYFFEYGRTTSYESSFFGSQFVDTDDTDHAVLQTLTHLAAGTTFHYRVVALTTTDAVFSTDRTFTTPGTTEPPSVTVGTPMFITDSFAQLQGGVNPHRTPTTFHIEYGTTPNYGSNTYERPLRALGSGNSNEDATDVPFQVNLSGLSPGTTYHYRIVATNAAGGVTNSSDATFTTTSPAANRAPSCSDQSVAVAHDMAKQITLSCSDPDTGDTLTYAILGQPSHGTVTVPDAAGTVTYTPTGGYSGADSFTFRATDNHQAGSNTATTSLAVAAPPPPPGVPPVSWTLER